MNFDLSVLLYNLQSLARLTKVSYKPFKMQAHNLFYVLLFHQASEKKEHKFKFATHMPSKMEQVILYV